MDFMKLFGTVIAVLFHPGSASKLNGQRICRRGTERPCYKVSYIQDSRRRLTFEDARQACRLDGGELLSIETESEQRLIERFIQQLQAGDGDFWIGLRRNPQHNRAGTKSQGCPSQFYWLDGSKAKFRNWHWDEPSCGDEMCVVLYHQPSAPPDEEGHFLFQWNDNNCNSKNNFVCKYPEEKVPVFTDEGNTARAVPSLRPNLFSTTESDERIKIVLPESSVSLSDNTLYVSYILYATIPALLLLLFAAAGFFCYKHHVKRRKTEAENYPCRSKPWLSKTASPCSVQGPYAFSDITKLPHTALESSMPVDIMAKYSSTSSQDSHGDYENVSCTDRESGFVTNDIYETCRAQSWHCSSQTGWVENEIYG
ncbi:layilin [Seriola aureovittata]|uniref:layilin n=1 Tax=Seriola aureovittata TaxID=2871759 RepID=UPI0024BEEE96|nr:layilin [Seriola aureovittata]XP_056230881.1 layilin [Seriola aureovittata]XP_056230883.1 layilin [Seriola aureovittata]